MNSLTRRDAIKSGGKAIVGSAFMGSALAGCGDETELSGQRSERSQAVDANDLFDRGAVPVSASGWTKTKGVGTHYDSLTEDLVTDVLVIGAGLAGSSLALHLSEQGVDTVVLEARQPGWGASGRNVGHVLPLLRDMEVFERFPDQGRAFFELFREHHTIPFDIANKYGIECDAVQNGYLNTMTSRSAFDKFKAASVHSADLLGQKLTDVDAATMLEMTGSDYYSHGLLYESGGRINPYLFTQGMVEAAVGHGARVFGDSAAARVSTDGQGWKVQLEAGHSVRCEKLIFCTNAYSSDVVPEFKQGFYPLTAYALSTRPLPAEIRDLILPSRATLAQVPMDLNPFIVDGYNRIVTGSIPSRSSPEDAQWHFQQHLKWIHRTWPATRDVAIELESYWTGRVAMREREFPGMYQLDSGIYGLMHFNAWGNVMAPLMGRSLALAIASDRPDQLPFPIVKPDVIDNPGKQEFVIRSLMIPAARIAQNFGFI